MNSSPNRRYLTDWLKETLTTDLKVGVIDAPTDVGWNIDPRSVGAYFEPYTVITPMAATQQEGAISDTGQVWQLPYGLTSYSVSNFGIEDQADTARRIVLEVSRVVLDLGGVSWRVIGTVANTIGAVLTNRSIEPPVLSQQDTVTIRISRVS